MWIPDLANSAFGGAVVAAAALLLQKAFDNNRAKQERKETGEKEQRDYKRKMQEAWREERKDAHTRALSAFSEITDSITRDETRMWYQSAKNKKLDEEGRSVLCGVQADVTEVRSDLVAKVNTVDLIGSTESSHAAWDAFACSDSLYVFLDDVGWGTTYPPERREQFRKKFSEYRTALRNYHAAAKADLGTDS
jgi:hypothetical protein